MKIKILIVFTTFIFLSCSNKKSEKTAENNNSKTKSYVMNENQSLQERIVELKKSMIEYMQIAEPSYTENDVKKCCEILEEYLTQIANTNSKDEAMEIVKSTVLKLNELNETANSELIETDEREKIADIIISATHQKGYNSMNDDVTEEWREW